MLIRNRQFNLFSEADDKGATPPPDTQQDKNGTDNKGAKTYTQQELDAELSRVGAKEKRDGKAAAEKAMAEALGMSIEDAKKVIESHKAKEESEKTEAQKLQDEIAQLKKERDSEKEARSQVENQRRLDKRDSELKMLLFKAQDADNVLILMKATEGEKLESLLDENGNFDKVNAEKLVAEYSKNNAYLFKDTRIGSALSNRDGKAPEPNKDLKEAAAKRTFKNMRNNI